MSISRRTLLTAAAALAAAPAILPLATGAVRADAAPAGKQAPGVYRMKLGSFEVTAVTDGNFNLALKDGFVRNAPFADVQKRWKTRSCPRTRCRSRSRHSWSIPDRSLC